MFYKLAQSVQMAFTVPTEEKQKASQTIKIFDETANSLELAKDYLENIYQIFQKNQTIDPKMAKEKSFLFNRIKKEVNKKFEISNKYALQSLKEFNFFSNDPTSSELMKSFQDSMLNIGKQVEIFLRIIDDFGATDFRDKVITAIDNIKSSIAQTDNLIKSRIISHINDNIIAEPWENKISPGEVIESREPLIKQLYKERQQALEGGLDIQKKPQELNPGSSQQVFYPNDGRTTTTEPENSFKHWE